MRKNKNHRIARTPLLYMLALLFAFAPLSGKSVYAQEPQADIVLPVIQKFISKNVQHDLVNQKGIYELTALDPGIPMPEGSANSRYMFAMEGDGQTELSMAYVHGGQYRYKLRQITEDAEKYNYDKAVYRITVYVKNNEEGQLVPQIIVENEHNEKYEKILFENTYTGKKVTPAPQKPNHSNTTKNNSNVKTGDNAPVIAWCTMLTLSLLSIAAILILKKQTEKEQTTGEIS